MGAVIEGLSGSILAVEPGAVGARPDGVHPRLSHHPRAARRVVGVHGPDRQLPRDQARRHRCAATGPALVQVHGGDVRRRRCHRHGSVVRVRAAVAAVHGAMGGGLRCSVRLRRDLLLHRGDLHLDLHLRLAAPVAVGSLLDWRPRRAHRHPRQRLGRRRQRLDELAGGIHPQQRWRGDRRRPVGGDLQRCDATDGRPHGHRRLRRRWLPDRLRLRGGHVAGAPRPLSPSRVPDPVHASRPSPFRCRWLSATRWPAGCTTTSRPSSRRSSWSRGRRAMSPRRCSAGSTRTAR